MKVLNWTVSHIEDDGMELCLLFVDLDTGEYVQKYYSLSQILGSSPAEIARDLRIFADDLDNLR